MADRSFPDGLYDIAIVGGGPAGLTAGLYGARGGLRTLLFEGVSSSSQIAATDLVENYPGIPDGINGYDLVDRFRAQALGFGLRIHGADVTAIHPIGGDDLAQWAVEADGRTVRAIAVVLATGANWRRLGVPGEDVLIGRGVSFCATCDGPLYRNREVVVVGGGDTAVQEALFLTRFAKRVTLVHRRNRLRAAASLREKASANDRVVFAWDSEVAAILGEGTVTGVRIRNVREPERQQEIPADGVFIFIGLLPNTQLVRGLVEVDDAGYILADRHMRTSAAGLFACGDCTAKPLRQVVTACGDGATAAFSAQLHVEERKGTAY